MQDLRCPSRLHGRLLSPGAGVLEVKCSSRRCHAGPGVVVLHRFDLRTAELVATSRYRNPQE